MINKSYPGRRPERGRVSPIWNSALSKYSCSVDRMAGAKESLRQASRIYNRYARHVASDQDTWSTSAMPQEAVLTID